MSSRCRSCGATIVWAITESGKRMPMDAAPVIEDLERGLFELEATPAGSLDGATARAATRRVRHRSHFATCPDADKHRKP